MIAFGPVPSRRLGSSLGINNIPPKSCSYNCVYCQVGPTPHLEIERRQFYELDEIVNAVEEKVAQVKAAKARIDYLTFVPDGEPALDIHLGETIERLKHLGIRIAIITNASLLWREDVRAETAMADYVSIKMDTADEDTWRRINRPNSQLSFSEILGGVLAFSKSFRGELVTETMLIKGLNDSEAGLKAIARTMKTCAPSIAYLAVPTRPPSSSWVQAPNEESLNQAFHIFASQLKKVEYLIGFPPGHFPVTGHTVQSLLDITAVHPMRETEAQAFLQHGGEQPGRLAELCAQEKLVRIVYEGQAFYVRKLR